MYKRLKNSTFALAIPEIIRKFTSGSLRAVASGVVTTGVRQKNNSCNWQQTSFGKSTSIKSGNPGRQFCPLEKVSAKGHLWPDNFFLLSDLTFFYLSRNRTFRFYLIVYNIEFSLSLENYLPLYPARSPPALSFTVFLLLSSFSTRSLLNYSIRISEVSRWAFVSLLGYNKVVGTWTSNSYNYLLSVIISYFCRPLCLLSLHLYLWLPLFYIQLCITLTVYRLEWLKFWLVLKFLEWLK